MTNTTEPPTLADLGRVTADMRRLADEREAAIIAAVASGMSQREVARAAGLSHTAVQNILRRAERAA